VPLKWLPFVLVAAFVAAAFLIDRILLWMERRGWIFYRTIRPDSRNVGPAFLEVQSLFEPGVRHVLEEKMQQREEEDDEGGPDKAGRKRGP
jgi:hypothetical protein